jgi:hypothetical protein
MTRARPRPKVLKTTRTEVEVMAACLDAAAMLGLDLQRQNTGAGVNPAGRMVRFGRPGDSDLHGTLPDGRTLHVECKREGFDPARLSGAKRAHFDRQLARLQRTNALGGVGFWTDDAAECLEILRHVLAGARVVEPGYGRPTVVYPETRKEQRWT